MRVERSIAACIPVGRTIRRRACGVAVGVVLGVTAAAQADELDDLVGQAIASSPVVKAARQAVAQAVAAREAVDAFLDPTARAAGGRTWGSDSPPLLTDLAGLPSADAYGAAASVEVPLSPGLYAGAGASEQYLVNPGGYDRLYRTLIGAQIRMPLLQDRGFAQSKQERERFAALRSAAEARLTEARQSVRHAVEQAYIGHLEAIANAATSGSAMERGAQLLREAEELVRLKVVPEYQLAPARLEMSLRREEARAAAQAVDTARLRLVQALGGVEPVSLATNAAGLVDRGAQARLPATPAPERALAARGSARELAALALAAGAATRTAADRLKSDLSLSVRGVMRLEDENAPPGEGTVLEGSDEASAAALLVWSRPWHRTGPRARLREAQSVEAELAERRRELATRLAADLAAAHRDFGGARERLAELTAALDEARRSLEAEAERFRLGDGRSRNVLDAQNDLTKTLRTRNAVAAALLRGQSDYLFAAGYNPDDSRAAGVPPLGDDHGGHR